MYNAWLFLLIPLCFVLASCDRNDQSVIDYVNEVKQNTPQTTEPLVETSPYISVKYTSYNLRSPFAINNANIKTYTLDKLPNDFVSEQTLKELDVVNIEFIQVNYAKAVDMVAIIKDKTNSLLSPAGQISIDPRTNMLLVKDAAANLLNIKQLLTHLDVPIRQVMIEAQIVETSNNYKNAFGFQMHGNYNPSSTKNSLFLTLAHRMPQDY
jgi:Type II secretory pathway, component PulD